MTTPRVSNQSSPALTVVGSGIRESYYPWPAFRRFGYAWAVNARITDVEYQSKSTRPSIPECHSAIAALGTHVPREYYPCKRTLHPTYWSFAPNPPSGDMVVALRLLLTASRSSRLGGVRCRFSIISAPFVVTTVTFTVTRAQRPTELYALVSYPADGRVRAMWRSTLHITAHLEDEIGDATSPVLVTEPAVYITGPSDRTFARLIINQIALQSR
jgi:hypothetical protein